jgi:protocatechuate 3,4-dioxygenase beta subunit
MSDQISVSRRRLITGALAVGGAFWTTRGLFADELQRTPPQTEGPFYPDRLPLDTDNDLLILNHDLTPAIGDVTHLGGRILDPSGQPVRNALVEIWQVDHNGIYIHTKCEGQERRDAHFQGYGKFMTGSTGEYYFRTVKPVPYPGRTPHIHVKVRDRRGKELLTSQCYVKGEALNEKDGVFRAIDPKLRGTVLVDFAKMPSSRAGELLAHWDIILGVTPDA